MIQISDKQLFGKVIADSLVRVDQNNKLNTKEKMRWINAIGKAVLLIENQPDFIEYHPELDMVTIWNVETNQVYNANGKCECSAFMANQPCKHRAVKQLVKYYLEAEKEFEGTVSVPLSQGFSAIIDAEDAEKVLQYKWTVHVKNDRQKKTFYARRNIWGKEKQVTVWLHRFILDAPKGLQVDHINGNPLDNRKANLRLATNSQNHCNIPRTNKTGFRGVFQDKKKFAAKIGVNSQIIHIGSFDTAEEAAKAYDQKAKDLHGEFAILNFPPAPAPVTSGAAFAADANYRAEMANALYYKPEIKSEKIGGFRI